MLVRFGFARLMPTAPVTRYALSYLIGVVIVRRLMLNELEGPARIGGRAHRLSASASLREVQSLKAPMSENRYSDSLPALSP
jgi:hypothetical protein